MMSLFSQRTLHGAVAVAAVLALGACGTPKVVDEAVNSKPASSEFNRSLQADYVALATSELQQADRSDAEHYSMKAIDASEGKTVPPDLVTARGLEPASASELSTARSELVAALNSPNAAKNPAIAAKAQSNFDCWLEQQEEGWQYDDIARCRDGYKTAMQTLTAPVAAQPPAETQSVRKVVYFKFDSDELIPSSQSELTNLINEAKLKKPKEVQIISYTDLSGTKEYNAKLATMRGQSIEQKLMATEPQVIEVDARGAVDPVVDTLEPNQENRRAVIIMN